MDKMRLQKYLANNGIASRRESEKIISEGRVIVNGQVISEMGFLVEDRDEVFVDGKPVIPVASNIYILLNKPVGYVSTAKDQFARPTVLDLVKDKDKRLYPVGRLDYDTSGLILLTNDGDFTYKMTHPSHEAEKTYLVKVVGTPTNEKLEQMRNGLAIEDYVTSPAKVLRLKAEQILNSFETEYSTEYITNFKIESMNSRIENNKNHIDSNQNCIPNDKPKYNQSYNHNMDREQMYIGKHKDAVSDKDLYNFDEITYLEITIHEGRNRQVRKMCQAIGHPVISLKRTKIACLELGNLKPGEYRYLSSEEVAKLLKTTLS